MFIDNESHSFFSGDAIMSWLYTLVFTGLIYSAQSGAAPIVPADTPAAPANVAAVRSDEVEKFEQSYPLTANGRVNVSNVNGSITVEAWDKNEVKLEYTKIADTKDRLADVEIKIESRADYFSAETDYGDWKRKNGGDRWRNGGKLNVEFRLMVPRSAILKDVETVNGSVTVSNFTNITRVSAVNGTVIASNLRGSASLSTVNGEVTADFDRLDNSGKISLETVNGRVNLTIPSDSNATVRAESLNGNISNDFGLPVSKGKYVGRDLYGKIGSGEVQIRLESVNGGLAIKRKSDGKSLNPSVNLLPNKDKDEEDWDDDEAMADKAKIDKEVAKAAKAGAKESAKAATKAMEDAQVQLKALKPELAKITKESIAVAAESLANSAKLMSTEEYKQMVKDAQRQQEKVLASISDAFYSAPIPSVERKSASFPVTGTPKVTVEAKGCSVTVRGWDKSEVQYRVVQFSDPRSRKPLSINDDHSNNSVTLKIENLDESARGGDFSNDRNRVRVEIYVPRRSNLKITSNGEIRLDGVSGEAELVGANEAVNIRDMDGKLKVSNDEGRVRIIGFRGDLETKTVSGDVFLEGDFSKVSGQTDTGNFYVTVPDIPNMDIQANIDALTVEDLAAPKEVSENHWRFGAGGPDYRFKISKGQVFVKSSSSLSN